MNGVAGMVLQQCLRRDLAAAIASTSEFATPVRRTAVRRRCLRGRRPATLPDGLGVLAQAKSPTVASARVSRSLVQELELTRLERESLFSRLEAVQRMTAFGRTRPFAMLSVRPVLLCWQAGILIDALMLFWSPTMAPVGCCFGAQRWLQLGRSSRRGRQPSAGAEP
jgi:hypothetical protein